MTTEERIKLFKDTYQQVKAEIGKTIVGHEEIVDGTLIALFAGGHALLEGVPDPGKTRQPSRVTLCFARSTAS